MAKRLKLVRYGGGSQLARKALKDLDDKLAADNATGHMERNFEKLILIPGRSRLTEGKTGPIEEAGELDGEVIQIGGRETIGAASI